VLDGVERGRLPVEPAREDSLELALRRADVELDEGAGQLLRLPWRARLAGAKPDDGVADAYRLAGPKLKIARNAVALVEQPDDRDSPGHRRGAGRDRGHRLGNVDRLRLLLGRILALGLGTAIARRQQGEAGKEQSLPGPGRDHSCPGVQAS
jgi:hypothetical protein